LCTPQKKKAKHRLTFIATSASMWFDSNGPRPASAMLELQSLIRTWPWHARPSLLKLFS